jgi:hypothetical protein
MSLRAARNGFDVSAAQHNFRGSEKFAKISHNSRMENISDLENPTRLPSLPSSGSTVYNENNRVKNGTFI